MSTNKIQDCTSFSNYFMLVLNTKYVIKVHFGDISFACVRVCKRDREIDRE